MSTVKSASATSPLAKASGTSLHRQLFMVLRDEISRGVYAEKGALPREIAICERFAVSRITVRRALSDLAAQGYVDRRHGQGTFVRDDIEVRRTPSLTIVDELRLAADETSVQVLEVASAEPPVDVTRLLGLQPQARAVHAVRLRSAGGVPVMLTDAWVAGTHGRGVTQAALRKRPLYEILIAQGMKFGRVLQETSAQPADPSLAEHLQVGLGSPILRMVRLMHDHKGHPVLHISVYLTPERSRVLMDLPGKAMNTMGGGRIVHDVAPPPPQKGGRSRG
ncbi:GntR family transcriptional regulator [Variovorax sp. KK3]|uniref:GntR family transcriptional regulator n=1 Tax=Variovorax sp. KK3 TaxID=1855728 RepID=UPI00097CA1F2|nr:GntR family transcriptional regulator [Variovorax sp. KK3]